MKIKNTIKEKLARTIGNYFVTNQVVNILSDLNLKPNKELYAKWNIILDSISTEFDVEEKLLELIVAFCHPVNFIGENEKRDNFIKDLNNILQYENLQIFDQSGKTKIVAIDGETIVNESPIVVSNFKDLETKEGVKDEQSIYTKKVLDLVVETFNKELSSSKVDDVVGSILQREIPKYWKELKGDINEFNSSEMEFGMFPTLYRVFDDLLKSKVNFDYLISEIICELLHPLNFYGDTEKPANIAKQLNVFLKYNKLHIEEVGDNFNILTDEYQKELVNDYKQFQKQETEEITASNKKIDKEKLKKLLDLHKTYIDVIETICENISSPTTEINQAYLSLVKIMQNYLSDLNIQSQVNLYIPFKSFYDAEMEQNESLNNTGSIKLYFDNIRPMLYKVQGQIDTLYSFATENDSQTDDDKVLDFAKEIVIKKRIKIEDRKPEAEVKNIVKHEHKHYHENISSDEVKPIQKGQSRIYPPKFQPTDWGNITFQFLNEEDVHISIKKDGKQTDGKPATYESLGFKNSTTGRPDKQWEFLLLLSSQNGYIQISDNIPDNVRKIKSNLANNLKKIFNNRTDPFDDFKFAKGYKILINLIAPPDYKIRKQEEVFQEV